jgi:hypothetical protein
VANFAEAVTWLEAEAHRVVRAAAVPMDSGMLAFPPQVGTGDRAFWLRDYEYALEGAIESFSNKELTDACRLFAKSIREDGACECIDGKYMKLPGYMASATLPLAGIRAMIERRAEKR